MAKLMFTARIEAEEEEFLKELGGGDRTAGFRLLLSRGMKGASPAPKKPEAPQLRTSATVKRPVAPAHPGAKATGIRELQDRLAAGTGVTGSRMRFIGRK